MPTLYNFLTVPGKVIKMIQIGNQIYLVQPVKVNSNQIILKLQILINLI